MESGEEPNVHVSPEPETESKDVPEDTEKTEAAETANKEDTDNTNVPADGENPDVAENTGDETKAGKTGETEDHANEETFGDNTHETKDDEHVGDVTAADEEGDDPVVKSPHADDDDDDTKPETNDESNPESKEASGPPTARSTDTPECLAKPAPVDTIDEKGLGEIPTNPSTDTNPTPEPTIPSPEPETKKKDPAEPPPAPPQTIQGTSQAASQGPSDLSPGLAPCPHPSVVTHRSGAHSSAGIHTSLSLNQMAIAASSQNKLPSSRLKGILERLSKHTESSAGKRGPWYKSDTGYVDMNSYSWKNLAMYKHYQQQMWTDSGTIKLSCKK